jgi:hypothetical protein
LHQLIVIKGEGKMGRIASSGLLSTMLSEGFSTMRHIVVGNTKEATKASCAWKLSKSGGVALARHTTASNIINTPASTTVGFTVATCSANSLSVTSSGNARHIYILGGTATSMKFFGTVCTTRALTTTDTVSIPSFNIRLADPTSS